MRFLIIFYISLGFILSLSLGIEYECEGQEMFPTYYGSPFVFKQESLASSMEYYYSLSGLLANMLIWSIFLHFIDRGIKKISIKRVLKTGYKAFIAVLIVFSSLNIAKDLVTIGSGFNKNGNYWYWNVDQEAEEWGMECGGKGISIF